ncbi:MSCRAMM family adhesin SdrC [Adhaeretor mobilis]|uniref:MSCRAMM family adhesin SdrC n=1 Tax=Adhaeretor mobilis TaxID=1930276 RepID=UPI001C54D274|nr:MSCRAMM family adhesin SdrC [Adhaeretor mobilis]
MAADLASADIATASLAGRVHLTSTPTCQTDHQQGLAEVTLLLLDEQGQSLQTATSDETGAYEFTGLQPGLYAVLQRQPEGLGNAGTHVGSGGGQVLAANLVGEIEVAAGDSLTGYNFCETNDGTANNDGPPVLTQYSTTALTVGRNNTVLQVPASRSGVAASEIQLQTIAVSVSAHADVVAQGKSDPLLQKTVFDSQGFSKATSRSTPAEAEDSEARGDLFGAALRTVRKATMVDELFESASWLDADWHNSVIDQLMLFAPKTPTSAAAEAESAESQPAPEVEVARLPEQTAEVAKPHAGQVSAVEAEAAAGKASS